MILTGGRIAAIGTFDGIHLGHQKLFRRLVREGDRLGLEPMAAFFDYSPRLFLKKTRDTIVRLLTTIEERRDLLRRMFDLQIFEVLPMNRRLFSLSAASFLERYVKNRWRVEALVYGDGFALGADRLCDSRNFDEFGGPLGISGIKVNLRSRLSAPVSSTRIRELFAKGQFSRANRLLGRPYSVTGLVVRERGIATRSLGFPTANLRLDPRKILPPGVYRGMVPALCRVAVINIGSSPTFFGPAPALRFEAHILDFRGNLYGRTLTVELLEKIREERKFPTLSGLRRQIEKDVLRVRRAIIGSA